MPLSHIIKGLQLMRHEVNYCLIKSSWEWALIECVHDRREFSRLDWINK